MRERNVMARAVIDMGDTTKETLNANETNPVPVEETEPAENREKKKKLIQSDQLRFLLPIELKKLIRLPN